MKMSSNAVYCDDCGGSLVLEHIIHETPQAKVIRKPGVLPRMEPPPRLNMGEYEAWVRKQRYKHILICLDCGYRHVFYLP